MTRRKQPAITASAAVVFDMDGTLLDTIDDIADSMNAVLGLMGLPPLPVERYRDFVGDGIDALAGRALPEGIDDPEMILRAADEMRRIYSGSFSRRSRPFEGVPEMLDILEARGVRMSILTNKLDEFAKAMAGALLPGRRFALVQGMEDGLPRKPDPAGALRCASAMGVRPGMCAFVGDSAVDMLTARAASMRAVGALWGYQDAGRLVEAGADALAGSPLDLPALLGL